MNADEFIKIFRKESVICFKEDECLGCSENVNWIVYLQICLEETGVSLEKFCDTSMKGQYNSSPSLSFRIEKNRLLFGKRKQRVGHKFVSVGSIRSMLEQILDY